MRVLLDENLDHRLRRLFDKSFKVVTVAWRGWAGKKNGELLQLAQVDFDVFITMDKGIEHQQNMSKMKLAIIILSARTNRYADTAPLIPKVNQVLRTIQPSQIVHVI